MDLSNATIGQLLVQVDDLDRAVPWLANGQVWQVTDVSSRVYDVNNPKWRSGAA